MALIRHPCDPVTFADPFDPWPVTHYLIVCSAFNNIVNLSHTSGQFHHIFQKSVISPLLKKHTLDKDPLRLPSNLQPVSHTQKSSVRIPQTPSLSQLKFFTILTSLPTASITPLKQPYCTPMIISCHRITYSHVSAFLPLSTPLDIDHITS